MSDRTLCDTTFRSKSLARLSERAFGLFPYIFQQTDDFGTLEADPILIKAQRFPLVKWITLELIRDCLLEYHHQKMLFLWQVNDHWHGHFVGFEGKSGKFLSKRRKSDFPKPLGDELAKFLKDNNHFQTLPSVETLPNSSYKLSQVKLSQVKLNNVSLSLKNKDKETPSAPQLSTNNPQKPKNSWEETRVEWKKAFGEEITSQQIGRLLQKGFAFHDKDPNCAGILQFIREHRHTKFTDGPYAYAMSLTTKEKSAGLNLLKSRVLASISKETGLSSIGEILREHKIVE